MKERRRKYEEISPAEFLLLREKLGIGRYRKTRKRDEEERKILLEIGLKKMKEKEEDDFIPIGYRTRRVKVLEKWKKTPLQGWDVQECVQEWDVV